MRETIAFPPPWALVSAILLASALYGSADDRVSQKLESIIITDHHLDGSPKNNVRQLNKLAKKYDFPWHEGIVIRFDPAVDAENCTVTSRHETKPLGRWLQDICDSCGSRYRVDGKKVIIELLPISEKQTPNLEAQVTNGIVEICRQFRANRGRERFALGEQIYRLLPRSPITWQKELPMHLYTSFDFKHPSYTLYKRDVLLLLGEPDRNVNNDIFCYSLRPRRSGFAELSVEFGGHDYAINPGLHWR